MLNSNYHFEMLKRNISVVFSNIFLNLSTFSSWNVKFKLWRIRKSKSGRTSRKFVCFSKSRRPNVFLELLFKVGVNQSEFRLVRLRSPNFDFSSVKREPRTQRRFTKRNARERWQRLSVEHAKSLESFVCFASLFYWKQSFDLRNMWLEVLSKLQELPT